MGREINSAATALINRRGLVTVGEMMGRLAAATRGPLRHTSQMVLGVGGAEGNVAIGVARLGEGAAWIGRIGADEIGALIMSTLRGEGVDVSAVHVDDSVPTSLALHERWASVRVTYYRSGGPGARLQAGDLDTALIAGAAVLHVTGITAALSPSAKDTVYAAVEIATSANVPVSFDVNYRAALWAPDIAAPVLRDLARRSDILFAGEDEARLLGLTGEAAGLVAGLSALGPQEAILKQGPRGAVAIIDNRPMTAVPVPTSPYATDPVGAGDAFVAGYLADRIAGAAAQQRLTTASACGASVASTPGDWEGLPSRSAIARLERDSSDVLR